MPLDLLKVARPGFKNLLIASRRCRMEQLRPDSPAQPAHAMGLLTGRTLGPWSTTRNLMQHPLQTQAFQRVKPFAPTPHIVALPSKGS